MLSIAWTPRSRFSPPQRMLSTQDTIPGRVTGSSICVGAVREQGRRSRINLLSEEQQSN